MKTKMAYLASPYSHEYATVEAARYETAAAATTPLIKSEDMYVFSPIAYSHPLYVNGWTSGGDWEYWSGWDSFMVLKCDEFWVLMIDGWGASTGIDAEYRVAKAAGKPIKFVNANTLEVIDGASARGIERGYQKLRGMPPTC